MPPARFVQHPREPIPAMSCRFPPRSRSRTAVEARAVTLDDRVERQPPPSAENGDCEPVVRQGRLSTRSMIDLMFSVTRPYPMSRATWVQAGTPASYALLATDAAQMRGTAGNQDVTTLTR